MRAIIFVFCGLCWIGFALLLGFLAVKYIANGADINLFLFSVSPLSVLFGWVKVLGLIFAAVISMVFGIGLCIRGATRPERKNKANA